MDVKMELDNVIYVNFAARQQIDESDLFLIICREELCEDDYDELLEAIVDYNRYLECEHDIKELVDIYLNR
jgi:hypothetical protein